MGIEREVERLEEDVKKLEDMLRRESSLIQKGSRLSTVVVVAVAVAVMLFIVVNVVNFRNAFTEEKLSYSLEREMRELQPAVTEQLKQLGHNVVPVYAEEARKQLSLLGPEITDRFQTEINHLGADVMGLVEKRLRQVHEKVQTEAENLVFESIPSLRGSSEREQLRKRLHVLVEQGLVEVLDDFHKRFGKHVESVQRSILEVEAVEVDTSPLELQKKFIHLWLQLLDQEIMEL